MLRAFGFLSGLELEDFPHRRLGAFDLRRQDRFLCGEGGEQHGGVWDCREHAVISGNSCRSRPELWDEPCPIQALRRKRTELVVDSRHDRRGSPR